MKIQNLTITEDELAKAVEMYLEQMFGIVIKVEDVKRKYSYSSDWDITVKIEEKPVSTPVTATIEDV